jgi:ADP-heptose:LPS heptosyltransferase
MTTVIAARSDSMGDVLLMGPALRAMAVRHEVTLLCGPRGRDAARLLPGISQVICAELPWIDPEPRRVTRTFVDHLVDRLASVGADQAVIFTSFHQSALPLALLMRVAGVRRISAISEDSYPGSLLDVRLHDPGDVHEVERALSLAAAAGFALPSADDRRLRILDPGPPPIDVVALGPYVVVHPGADAPARRWPMVNAMELAAALQERKCALVLTGARQDRHLTASIASAAGDVVDLAGRLDVASLAAVIRGAEAIVVANTGPAHLAAAVGTPVVSLFAPVVSAARWRPWMVPHVLLGDQTAPCAGTRVRECPVPGHPCLGSVHAEDVLEALAILSYQRSSPYEVRD